jgi:hypothetical protein
MNSRSVYSIREVKNDETRKKEHSKKEHSLLLLQAKWYSLFRLNSRFGIIPRIITTVRPSHFVEAFYSLRFFQL